MTQNLVSVILTCYNGEKWIGETIRSVLSQTYNKFELIIVNDGSTDSSKTIIGDFLKDNRLKYIEQKNRGIPGARNRGLFESNGEYVCILDQDDIWLPQKIEKEIDYLKPNTKFGVVYTSMEHIDSEGKFLNTKIYSKPKEGKLFECFLKRYVAVPIVTTMIRREMIDKVNGFDEKLFGKDDFDILLRISEITDFGLIPDILVKKRIRPERASISESNYKDNFYLIAKHKKLWTEYSNLIQNFEIKSYYLYGSYLLDNKRLREARQQFSSVLKLKPFYPEALVKYILTFLCKTNQKYRLL